MLGLSALFLLYNFRRTMYALRSTYANTIRRSTCEFEFTMKATRIRNFAKRRTDVGCSVRAKSGRKFDGERARRFSRVFPGSAGAGECAQADARAPALYVTDKDCNYLAKVIDLVDMNVSWPWFYFRERTGGAASRNRCATRVVCDFSIRYLHVFASARLNGVE